MTLVGEEARGSDRSGDVVVRHESAPCGADEDRIFPSLTCHIEAYSKMSRYAFHTGPQTREKCGEQHQVSKNEEFEVITYLPYCMRSARSMGHARQD